MVAAYRPPQVALGLALLVADDPRTDGQVGATVVLQPLFINTIRRKERKYSANPLNPTKPVLTT